MSKNLIIVESPTKARTLTKILGNKFKIIASKGHIRDLPENRFGISIKNNFKPYYVILKEKREVIKKLKEEGEKAKNVYLGCDPDREGEAIAFHIKYVIKRDDAKRVLFYEITEDEIKSAIRNPLDIDMKKVNSQQARRILDRIVGYTVSPFLWKTVKKGLSAGRVQTVALRLVVEREKEIRGFNIEKYYVIEGIFKKKDGREFKATLYKIKDKNWKSTKDKKEAEIIKKEIEKIGICIVEKLEKKKIVSKPHPPLKTSTLQQEASVRFRFSPSKTMKIAQGLYEGKEIHGKTTGLITYMRTDSLRINEQALLKIREKIENLFGKSYVSKKERIYTEKGRVQGAHEAIRPTNLEYEPEKIKDSLLPDEFNIYELIYRRTLASQSEDAVFEKTNVKLRIGEFLFFAQGKTLVFDGFYNVLGEKPREEELPEFEKDEELEIKEIKVIEKETEPPARYTEAGLIKTLEAKGIGRPSTYAPILQVLYEREYIKREQKYIVPTELGILTADILIPRFNKIFEIDFTARMEEKLDKIEEGEEDWQDFLKNFYSEYEKVLNHAREEINKIREDITEKVGRECPLCGKELVYRWSKYGKFIACSGFPECKYKERILQGVNCPKCEKGVLIKKMGKKKFFYGCSNYPECTFSIPGEPLEMKCASCGFPILVKIKKKRTFILCPECNKFIRFKRR